MRPTLLLSAILILVLALVPAAGAQEEPETDAPICTTDETRTADGDAVEYCGEVLYAQCDNAEGGKVVDPTAEVRMAATAPSAAVTDGAGCGTVDEPLFSFGNVAPSAYQYYASAIARVGNVDAMTVELHFAGPNGGYAGQELHLDLRVLVDGVSLFGTHTTPDATGQNPTSTASDARIVVPAVVSDSGASVSATFSIDGIADLDPARFAAEAGGGDKTRMIELTFGVPHTGECTTLPTNDTPRCAPSGLTGWVWGAEEIPSGITLNPAELAPTVVTATG